MNPKPESNSPETPAPSLIALDSPSVAAEAAKQERRSRAKIAQLPKVLRDLIHSMLDDGAPYALTIQKLQQSTDPPLPYSVSAMNLSRWTANGYPRYLV